LNTQYLRKALAEVANMQEDVKCVKDIKSVKDIKNVKDIKSVKDVSSVNEVIIDDFDDVESLTQVKTTRHSLKLIPE
jgi:hypothetical protein